MTSLSKSERNSTPSKEFYGIPVKAIFSEFMQMSIGAIVDIFTYNTPIVSSISRILTVPYSPDYMLPT
ncbi:MAG: hypothetical protein RE471_05850 [Ferroplasma sp.]|uniref:hypothetical protein n=1 Tax=Ferroplasma sp. TaxID=2591003 RepID=UPI002815D84A|nr:hypothetical protein [Ferroplasma sp.]WMT50503.1 MAG: hypothetical protein RE471_05850 [Ferroplasma sp.]